MNEEGSITAGGVFFAAILISLGLVVFLALFRRFLFICRPNGMLVVSGKRPCCLRATS